MPGAPSQTNSAARLGFLDILRAFGIAAVLLYHADRNLYHAPVWTGWHFNFADRSPLGNLLAVLLNVADVPTMFFVISGFLACYSMRRARSSIRMFYARRLFRLYIPYLAVLIFFSFIFPWTRFSLDSPAAVTDFVLHALVVFNFDPRYLWSINPAFWYIAVELQLCLMFWLLLALANRYGWLRAVLVTLAVQTLVRGAALCIAVASPEASSAAVADWPLVRWSGGYWFTWAIGAYVAIQYSAGTLRQVAAWELAGWLALSIVMTLVTSLALFAPACTAMLYARLITLILQRSSIAVASPAPGYLQLLSPPLRLVGALSLGIYLLHQPLMYKLDWELRERLGVVLPPTASIVLLAVVAFIAVLPAAWLFSKLVERPSQLFFDYIRAGGGQRSGQTVRPLRH